MYDVVVVGGGPGGYASALYAHNFGLNVAIVSDERFGGTCLLRGCIPAKQWLHVADVLTTVRHASDFGVFAGEPEMDWQTALAKKNEVVDVTVKGVTGLLKQRNATMVHGRGRLDGPGKVLVSGDDGSTVLEGRAVVMATGSHPRTIPGYEIDGERIVTSDHALDWTARPDRVAIVGGGVIGCEFASLLTDLGAEVHVFEVMDQIVPGSDPDGAKMLQRQLSRRGVKLHIGVGVDAPQLGPDGVVVPFGDDRIEVDVVLVSVGRGPNTSDVGFESTRAVVDKGFVKVDLNTMQTDEPGLYAVGDIVADTPQLAHVGFAEAITAVTHIATGRSEPVEYRAIPRVTYTHPEMAEVGLTERQAIDAGHQVETHIHYFNGVARARIIGEAQGIVKVISQKDGPILGASVVGPQAGEMIHELMYAVGWEALPSEAAGFIHAHPTLSEGIGETLLAAAGRSLH